MKDGLISLFQRTTGAKNFIPEIDGLRFIAIATVVIFHFHFQLLKQLGDTVEIDFAETDFTSAGWWLVRLDLGVKVFFGISGFILSIPFWKQYCFGGKEVNLREYFVRRLTRLEPPFILAISGFFLVHLFTMGESFRELLPHFLITLLYIHTLVYNEYSTILPVTWSLETEVQFYVLIPFLSYAVLRLKSKAIMVVCGLALFLGSIGFRSYLLKIGIYGLMASIPAFFSHFMVGIVFAYLYLTQENWLRSKSLHWDLIGLLAFLGMFFFYKPQSDFFFQILFNASIFLTFCSAFKGRLINRLMVFPPIYLIGGMCYSIYLLHLPLFGLFAKFSKNLLIGSKYSTAFWTQFPLALLVLLAITCLYFIAVEKPCMEKNWHLKLAKKIGPRNFS